MKKGDMLIFLSVGLFMLILYIVYQVITPPGEAYVEIKVHNQVVKTIPVKDNLETKFVLYTNNGSFVDIKQLNDNDTVEPDRSYDIIYIHDNGVEVIEANCPKKLVIKQGFMKYPNIPLICVPHHLIITIINSDKTDIDGISY